MGNRMETSAVCVRCGGAIIRLNPDFKMCSTCQKWAEERARDLIKKRNRPGGKSRRYKLKIGMLKK
jgi:hypothetical protein